MSRKIDELTVEDYTQAFESAFEHIKEHEQEIIRSHFMAPGFAATASELAYHVGYDGYRGINGQYGAFAARVCGRLGVDLDKPGMQLDVLVTLSNREDGQVVMTMRPFVVDAIRQLSPKWLWT